MTIMSTIIYFIDSLVAGISSERWYVEIKDAEYRERMRDMDQRYTSHTEEVDKRLDSIDFKMADLEKTTAAKLQQITELLEQLKKK